MLNLSLLVFLIIFIFPSNCRQQSVILQKPSLCINDTHFIPLFGTQVVRITLNQTRFKQLGIHTVRLRTSVLDKKVIQFENQRQVIKQVFHLTNDTKQDDNVATIVYDLKIYANYINRTLIDYSIETINMKNSSKRMNCSIVVIVGSPQRLVDKIFKNSIPFVIIFISVQMGMLLDVAVLKEIVRRPIQVLIGFVCQYIFMPIIAFSITKLFNYEPLYGLGLFVVGCCPGGSASNQWTVIFDGDLNLSTFMSFASTMASFIMMPIWLYTLGQYAYLSHLKIRIPFLNLAQALLTIIGPIAVGMLLVHFIPKLKPIIERIVKPTLILLIVYYFIFGAFVNYYLFRYIDLKTALTAPFLPWIGFLLGGLFAVICKQDWKRTVTIAIETGIQNVGIAFMILLYSFPAPENSQATVIPLIVAYLSTQPFYLVLIYRCIRGRCSKSKKPDPRISADTLNKTTNQLSDTEEHEEPPLDHANRRKVSIPIGLLGISGGSEPLEM